MHMLTKKTLIGILLLLVIAMGLLNSEIPGSKVVARVNGFEILDRDLSEKMNSIINQQYFHRNLSPERRAEVQKRAIKELIEEALLFQEAKRQKIKTDKKIIDAQFDKIRSRFDSHAAFKRALTLQGYSEKDFRDKLEREYLVKAINKENVHDRIQMTADDLRDYYEQNQDKFRKPRAIKLQHILIKVKDPTSDKAWENSEQKAIELVRRLEKGEDFSTLARNNSDDRYRIKGGNLGYVHKGRLLPELEKVGFVLKKGEISHPIKTHKGFHIIKLLDEQASRLLSYEEVKDKLKMDLEKKKEAEAMEELIKLLRSQADIEVFLNEQ